MKWIEFMYSSLLEKAMAPHSSPLAWKIPWTEEPGRLKSMGSLRIGQDWAASLSLSTFHFHALEKEMATHSSVLALRIPGMGEPSGLPSMGSHRVRHDWSYLIATLPSILIDFPRLLKYEISYCSYNIDWIRRSVLLLRKMFKVVTTNIAIKL